MNLLETIKNPKKALKTYNEKRKENLKALEYDLKVESILLLLTKDLTPKQSIDLFRDVDEKYYQLIENKDSEMIVQVLAIKDFLKK